MGGFFIASFSVVHLKHIVINESKLKGQVEEDQFEAPPEQSQLIEQDHHLQLNQNNSGQKLHLINLDQQQDQDDFAKGKFRSVELIEEQEATESLDKSPASN